MECAPGEGEATGGRGSCRRIRPRATVTRRDERVQGVPERRHERSRMACPALPQRSSQPVPAQRTGSTERVIDLVDERFQNGSITEPIEGR